MTGTENIIILQWHSRELFPDILVLSPLYSVHIQEKEDVAISTEERNEVSSKSLSSISTSCQFLLYGKKSKQWEQRCWISMCLLKRILSEQVVPKLFHQRLQTICNTNTPTLGKWAFCSLKTKHFVQVSILPQLTVPEAMDVKNNPVMNAGEAPDTSAEFLSRVMS